VRGKVIGLVLLSLWGCWFADALHAYHRGLAGVLGMFLIVGPWVVIVILVMMHLATPTRVPTDTSYIEGVLSLAFRPPKKCKRCDALNFPDNPQCWRCDEPLPDTK
jgi:hypothetical protein